MIKLLEICKIKMEDWHVVAKVKSGSVTVQPLLEWENNSRKMSQIVFMTNILPKPLTNVQFYCIKTSRIFAWKAMALSELGFRH